MPSATKEDNALQTIEAWARVAVVPETASNLSVEIEGSEFTRGFRVSFDLTGDSLETWAEGSPGLKDAKITKRDSATHYTIPPGGGAQHAEAIIDFDSGHVEIYTYWS